MRWKAKPFICLWLSYVVFLCSAWKNVGMTVTCNRHDVMNIVIFSVLHTNVFPYKVCVHSVLYSVVVIPSPYGKHLSVDNCIYWVTVSDQPRNATTKQSRDSTHNGIHQSPQTTTKHSHVIAHEGIHHSPQCSQSVLRYLFSAEDKSGPVFFLPKNWNHVHKS